MNRRIATTSPSPQYSERHLGTIPHRVEHSQCSQAEISKMIKFWSESANILLERPYTSLVRIQPHIPTHDSERSQLSSWSLRVTQTTPSCPRIIPQCPKTIQEPGNVLEIIWRGWKFIFSDSFSASYKHRTRFVILTTWHYADFPSSVPPIRTTFDAS